MLHPCLSGPDVCEWSRYAFTSLNPCFPSLFSPTLVPPKFPFSSSIPQITPQPTDNTITQPRANPTAATRTALPRPAARAGTKASTIPTRTTRTTPRTLRIRARRRIPVMMTTMGTMETMETTETVGMVVMAAMVGAVGMAVGIR